MKQLALLLLLVTQLTNAQQRFEKQLAKANTLFTTSKKQKAISIWEDVEKKVDQSSSTYGKVLRNLLYYYVQVNDTENANSYYRKIMNFNLNSQEKQEDIGESFLNTKYHSTLMMASLYKNLKQYDKALSFIDIADKKVVYHTSSISNYARNKIDLAMWRYWIYMDLEKNDIAMSYLIKRAFEYNYKAEYTDWYMDMDGNEEEELSKMILTNVENVDMFKIEMRKAVKTATYNVVSHTIDFTLEGKEYKINPNKELDTNGSKYFLRNAPFYKFIQNCHSMATNN